MYYRYLNKKYIFFKFIVNPEKNIAGTNTKGEI